MVITQLRVCTRSWQDCVGHSAQGAFEKRPLKKGIVINVLGACAGCADLQWITDQPENRMVQEQMQAAWVTDAKDTHRESPAK